MKKSQILRTIKKFCDICPLRCDEDCRLYKLKNGEDPDGKRALTPKQIEALMKSHKRQGLTDDEFKAQKAQDR